MQSAATLLGVIQDRGSKGLPLERVYRYLFNQELYLKAFARIASNEGALTPGVTAETADGMSLGDIDAIIEALRFERYRWTPARRVYIEKKNSKKKRPLGIHVWSDKLLQEVLRMILEAYFEPQFSPRSHGFRLGRGCHTALQEIKRTWLGTTWFVEGDIAACFDSLDHSVMLSILGDKIHDGRFLRLMKGLLEAGYLEEWTFNATPSGTPQGGASAPSSPTSTSTPWTSSSRRHCCKRTTGERDGNRTGSTHARRGGLATWRARVEPKRQGRCAGRHRPCRRWCSTTGTSAACATCATPTISCSDSADQRSKQRR